MGDQPVSRPLPTHRTTHTQNKRIQTSVPCVGFEPPIPVFVRAKTVHALDRAALAIGCLHLVSRERMVELYFHSPIRLHGFLRN
jgi:hypothetical protein